MSLLVLLKLVLMGLCQAAVDPFKDDLSNFDFRPKYITHPMLFFTVDSIPILRARAETTHKHIMQEVIHAKDKMLAEPFNFMPSKKYEKFAARWNEGYGNNLPPLALYSMLYPDDNQVFEYVLQYMDNMVDVGPWQVIGQEKDEVPVCHQLVGFATAFDFLHPRFDIKRQVRYAQKVADVTNEVYELSKKRWWGKAYIQNHVATNTVAILIGALVSRIHSKEAQTWIDLAVAQYERTMWLFDKVADGSSNEGVGYGGYTARSLMQYVHLVRRHFNRDHSSNQWLKNHFWFYYATVLPGFQWIVGIGDSDTSWWYGPESQLVFLDNFIIKNGSGNWLAEQIRNHRKDNYPSYTQRWSMLHTEFIWYNASLLSLPPPGHGHGVPRLHIFEDWGVSTYGFAQEKEKNATFLSFKSGPTHGKAVFTYISTNVTFLDGWRSFNAGHEHPDKNSFVFAPNGELFVTEGLYGMKYTYLDNTLVFGPGNSSYCMEPGIGQLGECAKWLQVRRDKKEGQSRGELINSEIKDGFVHMSGEAAGAYSPDIGLLSYHRNILLLNPQLLLVHDHLLTSSTSKLSRVSSFFNNYIHNFKPYQSGKFEGFYLDLADGMYRALYTSYQSQRPSPLIARKKARRFISNVNITFNLEGEVTDIAYIFFGPDIEVRNLEFLQTVFGAVRVRVTTHVEAYEAKMMCHSKIDSVAWEHLNRQKFEVKVLSLSIIQSHVADLVRDPVIVDPHQLSKTTRLWTNIDSDLLRVSEVCRLNCIFYSAITLFLGFGIVLSMTILVASRKCRLSLGTGLAMVAFVASLLMSIYACIC